MTLSDETRVLLLAGIDQPSPRIGRTDALLLVFFHPRLGRASLVSLPPDLLVYIPGYGMQRLNTAFASGGVQRLLDTIQYNFGVRPDHYVAAPLDAFTYFIDDLGGLEVYNLYDMPDLCNLPPGRLQLDGQAILCYIRYRAGSDETERNRRQQEVVRLIVQRMAESGNLSRLADLYATYKARITTNLRWEDIFGYLPFVLTLGDHNRIGFYTFSATDMTVWEIPGKSPARVFLPDQAAIAIRLQSAAGFVLTPQPHTDRLLTLEAELTSVPTRTASFPATPTFPPPPTLTPNPTTSTTPTITSTTTLTPTMTPTETPEP